MKKKLLLLVLLLSVMTVTGCIKINKKSSGESAGVYKSLDKGDTWKAKRNLVLPDGNGSIAPVNVTDMYFDPQDNQAIYLLSEQHGLFYTYDGAENWFQPSQLDSGNINDLKVDPNNKCTIYIARGNKVLKSKDCSRSWSEIFIDTRPKNVSAVLVDSENDKVVYAGNVAGEILKSYNGGASWTTIQKFGGTIQIMLPDPSRGGSFYVVVKGKGIHKTLDGGSTWINLEDGLKKYSGSKEIYNLTMNQSNPNNLFLISRYGIIKSTDGGSTWDEIRLITPPMSTRIYAFVVNPQDSDQLYYATASTFYKSVDGGENWSTKRLPTKAAASYMLIDPVNPNVLYLGVRVINKK